MVLDFKILNWMTLSGVIIGVFLRNKFGGFADLCIYDNIVCETSEYARRFS